MGSLVSMDSPWGSYVAASDPIDNVPVLDRVLSEVFRTVRLTGAAHASRDRPIEVAYSRAEGSPRVRDEERGMIITVFSAAVRATSGNTLVWNMIVVLSRRA
jgi:hypothetical protein